MDAPGLASDDALPELSERDTTPMDARDKSDAWIKQHANDNQVNPPTSPYRQRADGSNDLVG